MHLPMGRMTGFLERAFEAVKLVNEQIALLWA